MLFRSRSEEHTSELQSHDNLVCRIIRSEEHTSELQSHDNLVCRLLLEKKKQHSSRLDSLSFFFNDTRTTEILTVFHPFALLFLTEEPTSELHSLANLVCLII